MCAQSLSSLNSLSVEVYDADGAILNDPEKSARQLRIDGFRKHFPGGIMGDGQMHALRRLEREWKVREAQQVLFKHGNEIAYEGYLGDMTYEVRGVHSVSIPLLGATEHYLMEWPHSRRFADNRIDEGVWVWDQSAPAKDKADPDRSNRLKVVPKEVVWASSDYVQFWTRCNTGSTLRRIQGSYQLQEGAQQWQIDIYRSTDGSTWTFDATISDGTTPTGTFDVTLGTATRYIAFRFSNDSGGDQTPAADGTILGEIYNIMVYETIETLTTDITMETMARFMIEHLSQSWGFLNADYQYIASPTTDLVVEPFIWGGWVGNLAEMIDEIVAMGDGDQLRWAWELLDSSRAATPNGRPVLRLREYPDPATDDYDYTIDYRASNLDAPPDIVLSRSGVYNWIPVRYQDADGNEQWITPNDDSSLTDAASISAFGLRAPQGGLDVGERGAAVALSFGQLILARTKDRRWRMTRPLDVVGYILDKNKIRVPACLIEPGKIVRVTGGPIGTDGKPPQLVITGVDYDHPRQSASIVTGSPLGPLLPSIAAQLVGASELVVAEAGGGGESGGGGGGGDTAVTSGGGGYKGENDLNFYKRTYYQSYLKKGGKQGKLTWKEKAAIKKWARQGMKKKKMPK